MLYYVLKDFHLILEARHIRWLIDTPHVVLLNKRGKDPEGHLLIAVVHDACHDEVHTLHIANSVIIIRKSPQNTRESSLVLVQVTLAREGLVHWVVTFQRLVRGELRHLGKRTKQVLLNVVIVLLQFRAVHAALGDVPVLFRHLVVVELILKQTLDELEYLHAGKVYASEFLAVAGELILFRLL